MLPYALATAIATIFVVVAERHELVGVRWIAKPLASAGFLGAAVAAGAEASSYGRMLLVALLLCFFGDLLLLSDSKRPFIVGLGSFLLAHAAFAAAFFARGVDISWIIGALALLAPSAFLVIRWLAPNLRGPLRIAVPAYVLTIVAMGATATGTVGAVGDWRIVAGAALFSISDLAVARNRFVERAAMNRIVGLPLYYTAQLLFAASVATRG